MTDSLDSGQWKGIDAIFVRRKMQEKYGNNINSLPRTWIGGPWKSTHGLRGSAENAYLHILFSTGDFNL